MIVVKKKYDNVNIQVGHDQPKQCIEDPRKLPYICIVFFSPDMVLQHFDDFGTALN